MTQRDKLRRRIEQNLKAVRFEDLDQLLQASGFQVRQPHGGSSHYFYKRGRVTISIPRRRPHLLPAYVKQALSAIDRAEEEEVSDG
jgi:hypothetical protein